MGNDIWKMVQRRVGSMEFLLDEQTFANLFLVDVDRNLQGKPTSISPNRIQNPVTGNLFHRIALKPPFVGGVRFWAEDSYGSTQIGFRFRIVRLENEDDEVNVREEARVRSEEVLKDIDVVYEDMMDIQEPPKQATEHVKQLVKNMEKE